MTSPTETSPKSRKIIGLVGGIASGKSLVANLLEKRGATVLRADAIGHQVLTFPNVIRELTERFGPEILDQQGGIDRKKLAARVFGGSGHANEERNELESIVHPRIRKLAEAQIQKLLSLPKPNTPDLPWIVLDAPLLFEAGWDSLCNSVLFVETPSASRLARAKNRGWTEQEWRERESAQMPVDEKGAKANWTVQNVGTVEELEANLQRVIDQIEIRSP